MFPLTCQQLLQRLHAKAAILFIQHRNGADFPTLGPPVANNQDNDCLSIFSGQTRGLTSKIHPQRYSGMTEPPSADVSSTSSGASSIRDQSTPGGTTSQSSGSYGSVGMGMPDVQPSVMEYISLFPTASAFSDAATPEIDVYAQLDKLSEAFDISLATGGPETSYSNSERLWSGPTTIQDPTGLNQPSASADFLDGDALQQFYAETVANGVSATNNIDEQGVPMNIGSTSGIDEDWAMFLKESGLV